MNKPRPALFKWRHFEPEIIVCAVRWYLRFSLSYQDVEELVVERGLPADHTSVRRWVQRYSPELNKRCRRELKPTNGSWRVDETYICQGGIVDRRDWWLVRFRRQNCFCNTTLRCLFHNAVDQELNRIGNFPRPVFC